MTNGAVAAKLGVHPHTVGRSRTRFVDRRLDGLHDEPRPGVPRKLGDDDIEAFVVKTLTDKPKDATHWSTRDMAKATGMSQPTVSRIWRAFGLKPWATDTFKLSEDPLFIEKVRDVVGIYLNPPEHAVVCCVDEKTGIQALDRTQPILPMRPGQVERRTQLRAQRDHRPVRGAQCRNRRGDRHHSPATPGRGVQGLHHRDRQGRAARA